MPPEIGFRYVCRTDILDFDYRNRIAYIHTSNSANDSIISMTPPRRGFFFQSPVCTRILLSFLSLMVLSNRSDTTLSIVSWLYSVCLYKSRCRPVTSLLFSVQYRLLGFQEASIVVLNAHFSSRHYNKNFLRRPRYPIGPTPV